MIVVIAALPPINSVHAPLLPLNAPNAPPIKPWDNVTVDQGAGSPSGGRKQRGGPLRASHSDHLLAFHNPLRLSLSAAVAAAGGSGGSENGDFNNSNDEIDPRLLNGTFGSKPQQQQQQQQFGSSGTGGAAAHPMTRVGSVPVFSGIHHVKVAEHTHNRSEVESSAKGELVAGRARRRELENFVR